MYLFVDNPSIPMMMILYLRNFLILKELQPFLTAIGKIIQTNLLNNTLIHNMHLSMFDYDILTVIQLTGCFTTDKDKRTS